MYLRVGTRLVWIVWPQSAHIDVWHVDMLTGPVAGEIDEGIAPYGDRGGTPAG